jgi:hypothetical protein
MRWAHLQSSSFLRTIFLFGLPPFGFSGGNSVRINFAPKSGNCEINQGQKERRNA